MSTTPIATFQAFWPYYLGEHRHPLCRTLHFVGSTLALGLVATAVVVGQPWLLLSAPVSGYAFSWVGHFFIEKNRPASFTYPLWSFAADWKMWALTLSGRLDGELTRLGIASSLAR